MSNILDVKLHDLNRLTPEEAVHLFARLLWATAVRLGIPLAAVDIPFKIYAPDGGIDARIDTSVVIPDNDLIAEGGSWYQIKSGAFSISGENDVKKLLCATDGALKPRVKACLDSGGCFFAVLFGDDPTDAQDARQAIIKYLAHHSSQYTNPRIRVLKQNQIIGCLQPFPSLRNRIIGRSINGIPFEAWSRTRDMSRKFEPGEPQEELIASIRSSLRENPSKPIRVLGDAGCGKTRTAHRAVEVDDLAALVMYFSDPEELGVEFVNELLLSEFDEQAILIVDDCDHTEFERIRGKLHGVLGRIRLVTLSNQKETTTPGTITFEGRPLIQNQIEAIFRQYVPKQASIFEYVRVCEGSPRAAHIFGEMLGENRLNILEAPSWEEYIKRALVNSSEDEWEVLEWLSLFGRLGYTGIYEHEFEVVSRLMESNTGMKPDHVRRIIERLKRSKLVQGSATIYITPEIVRIYLWQRWWKTKGSVTTQDIIVALTANASNTNSAEYHLMSSFVRMFTYAKMSLGAIEAATGFLQDASSREFVLGRVGAQFLFNLSIPVPRVALRALELAMFDLSDNQILEIHDSYYYLTHSLERIGNRSALFERASEVLRGLAVNEGPSVRNSAYGIFCDFFRPGHSAMTTTAAPPEVRLRVLKKLFDSTDQRDIHLALAACEKALDPQYSLSVDSDFSVLTEARELWEPAVWGEIYDYYKGVWNLLASKLGDFPKKISEVLAKAFERIFLMEHLQDFLIESVKNMLPHGLQAQDEFVSAVSHQLRFSAETEESTNIALKELYEQLVGNTFHDALYRYVANPQFADHEDDAGVKMISELARTIGDDFEKLKPELHWLATEKARNSYFLGVALAEQDANFYLLEPLVSDLKNNGDNLPNIGLWSGYLGVFAQKDVDQWKAIVLDLTAHDSTVRYVPEIVWRGNIDTEMADVILDLWRQGKIASASLQVFIYGGTVRLLSENLLEKWVRALLFSGIPNDYFVALDIFAMYYGDITTIPEALSFELLTSSLRDDENATDTTMSEYHWSKLADRYLKLSDARVNDLLDYLIGRRTLVPFRYSYREPDAAILLDLCKADPRSFWNRFSKKLEQEIETNRVWQLSHWLKESGGHRNEAKGHSAFQWLPKGEILAWIAIDPLRRASVIAEGIPLNFANEANAEFLPEFLSFYGDQKEVRSILRGTMITDNWSGPASRHYARKFANIETFAAAHPNPQILMWCDEAKEEMNQMRLASLEREEREGR